MTATPMTATTLSTPSSVSIHWNELRCEILKSWRMPAFVVPTLILPWAFYGFFGLALARPGSGTGLYLAATYSVFAAIGPCLFGFGIGLASEREKGLIELKRLSPMPESALLLAKLGMCLLFVLATGIGLQGLAVLVGGVMLPVSAHLGLLAVQAVSVLPFGLLGLSIGLLLKEQAALAAANLLFFPLCVLGGLWFPLGFMPGWMQQAAWALPSFHLGELALHAAGIARPHAVWVHAVAVAGFTALLAALAGYAWRRQAAV